LAGLSALRMPKSTTNPLRLEIPIMKILPVSVGEFGGGEPESG